MLYLRPFSPCHFGQLHMASISPSLLNLNLDEIEIKCLYSVLFAQCFAIFWTYLQSVYSCLKTKVKGQTFALGQTIWVDLFGHPHRTWYTFGV